MGSAACHRTWRGVNNPPARKASQALNGDLKSRLSPFSSPVKEGLPMIAAIEDMKTAPLETVASQAGHLVLLTNLPNQDKKMYLSPFSFPAQQPEGSWRGSAPATGLFV
jgi:hypothetical protein